MADQSFIGTGWRFPPAFGSGGAGVAMVSGHDDIEQCLQILLGTQLGERVMADDFGCDLHCFVFEEINQVLINNLTRIVSDAILYHEPRIRLDTVEVGERPDWPGYLFISIEYNVRSSNSRFNLVYPFYISEAFGPEIQ